MKSYLLVLSFFIFGFLHHEGQAQSGKLVSSDTIPSSTLFRSGRLSNGLHYYLQPNNKPENRAELRLVVRAGSLQEDADQLGLAHFVEHMAFNGTEHFARNELIDYLESLGTRFGPDLNAYTSFGETVYMLQVRTDSLAHLETGLLILEDWASGLRFDSNEVEKERGVVISEWRNRLSPNQRLQQQYFPVLYQGSRYAERLPIGEPAIIDTASVATIKRFYDDWYRPNLMAVVAVGNFDMEWMESQIRQRFSKLSNPATLRPREAYKVPDQPGTRTVICTDDEVPFTEVRMVIKHPDTPFRTIADFRASLARNLYNRMLGARLFELQQQAAPPFTFANSGYGDDLANHDVYYLSAFVGEGKALEGLQAVMTETWRARQHGFTATELERQKQELLRLAEKAANEQDKSPSASLASRLVFHYLEKKSIPDARQQLELYRQLLPEISLEEINPLPAEWLKADNRVIILTGPAKSAADLPDEDQLLDLIRKVQTTSLEPYTDNVSDQPLFSGELPPVPVTNTRTFTELEVTEITLANGVRVVLKPTNFKNDEILLTAFSPGGSSLYSDADFQSASTADALVNLGGIGHLSVTELQKSLAGKTVSVSPYIEELYEGISGRSAVEDLETMLQLTYLYFTAPRKDSTALQSYLTRQESILKTMYTNPYYYFAARKNEIKYENHPRRQMTSMEDLKKISLDRAFAIYQDRFADASDFTFVLVGNFSVEKILPMLQQYLGNLPAIQRQESWKDIGAGLAKGNIDSTFTGGKAPKAFVEFTWHGPFDYGLSQNRYDFQSMVDLLRIKLRESMREEQGGVYSVRLTGILSQHPSSDYRIVLSFNCDPAEVEPLLTAAMGEIHSLQEKGASEEDLQKIRETQRQNRIKGLKENSFWQGQLTARYREDIPLEGILLEKYEKYIDGLGSEALQKAARQYFTTDNTIRLILMPEAATNE